MPNRKISIQLYSIHEALDADLDGSLGKLSEIGLQTVEAFDFVRRVDALKTSFAKYGLDSPTAHAILIEDEGVATPDGLLTVPPAEETFASVLERGLGSTMSRSFYFPYARKLWGLAPEALGQREVRPVHRLVRDHPVRLVRRPRLGLPRGEPAAASRVGEDLAHATPVLGELVVRSRGAYGVVHPHIFPRSPGRTHISSVAYRWSSAPVSTERSRCSMSSNSGWPMVSGGASWTTGSPRSSARQYRPASKSALDRKPRSIDSDSASVKVYRVTLSLTSSIP